MPPVPACLLLSLPGPDLPPQTARWLRQGLAGVIIFARNITSPSGLRQLCQQVRDANPVALVAVDEEGGEVTRLEASTGSSFPGARALGVVDDIGLTEAVAGAIAMKLAGAGANVNLAPVADVQTCAENPVIHNRSFGTEAALVGRHAAAFVRGTQSVGVAACAKHFPGHGATSVDSHLDLPVVELDRATLMAQHVAAFAPAVGAGVAMLMTAHVLYPSIDDRPATLSPVVLGDLVRRELGFEGVVITDALGMGAIAGRTGMARGAVGALRAGADLLCVDGAPEAQAEVVAGVYEALSSGDLSVARVEQAAERVQRLAASFPSPAEPGVPGALPGYASQLGLEAARRALSTGTLPALEAGVPFVVELTTTPTGAGEVRTRLTEALRLLEPSTTGLGAALDEVPTAPEVLERAAGRSLVLVTRDAHRHPAQASLVRSLLAARPGAVLVGTGSEADASLAPGRFIPARGAAPPNLRAVAEALVGRTTP